MTNTKAKAKRSKHAAKVKTKVAAKTKTKTAAKTKIKKAAEKKTKTTIKLNRNTTIIPQPRAKATDESIQCWAHSQNGKRCTSKVISREGEPIPIPYCEKHLKSGDGALKVVAHPLFGKALITRYDLPAKYRMAYWGIRGKCQSCDVEDRAISYYPPNPTSGTNIDPKVDGGRTLKTNNYNGVLNPGETGDVIQYAACPGPNEKQNMRSTFQYYGLRNGYIGGLEFVTLEAVPKGTQLLHWYGSGWWSERGIKRQDVGTKWYPAPLRPLKIKKKA